MKRPFVHRRALPEAERRSGRPCLGANFVRVAVLGLLLGGGFISTTPVALAAFPIPTLQGPGNGTSVQVNQSIGFSWSNTGASQYKIEAWNDTGSGSLSTIVNGTSYSWAPGSPGSWRWQVRSVSNGQPGDAPYTRSFTVTAPQSQAPPPPPQPQTFGVPTLQGPGNGTSVQVNQSIGFSWSYTGASQYKIEAWNDTGSGSLSTIVNGTSYSWAPGSPGSWRWQVRSVSNGQPGDAPYTRSFTVTAPQSQAPSQPEAPYPAQYENALVKGSPDPVWLLQGGQRHWVPNPDTLRSLQVGGRPYYSFSDSDINRIPRGSDVPAVAPSPSSSPSSSAGSSPSNGAGSAIQWAQRLSDIRQAFQDILGRGADEGGLNYYANGSLSINDVRNSMLSSDECRRGLGGQCKQLYGGQSSPPPAQQASYGSQFENALVTSNSGNTVWQLQGGQKHLVPDGATFNSLYNQNGRSYWSFSENDVNRIPRGNDIQPVTQQPQPPSTNPGSAHIEVPLVRQISLNNTVRIHANGSQTQATTGLNNCGPASVAMAIDRYRGNGAISLEDAANTIRNRPSSNIVRDGKGADNRTTDFRDGDDGARVEALLRSFNLHKENVNSFEDMVRHVSALQPVIVLVANGKYVHNNQPYDVGFASDSPDHIVVVTGYDANWVYINDPLGWPNSAKDFPVSIGDFKAAAGSWHAVAVVGN